MEHVSQEPTICKTCNTAPRRQGDGVLRCKCPDKQWYKPGPVRADAETTALLKQKGFDLAGCGWYYYGSGSELLTLFTDGMWLLENAQTTITDLKEYLLSLPDRKSPTET
jgi:hypothetical protein